MVCILASVFIFASDISAVSEKSILGTQWLTTGIMRVYLVTGEFLGAAGGGSGIMSIDGDKVVTGTYAITFDTTIPEEPLVLGTRADFTLSETTYNAKKGLLKGTSCAVYISYPEGGPEPLIYEGVCDATISFASPKTFKGKISFTIDYAGITVVIETSGTLLGKPVSLAPPP
jgi:hypothetical protein